MVQQVTDENGQLHEFPDDATPAEMNAALSSVSSSASMTPDQDRSEKLEQFKSLIGANRTPVDTIRDILSGALTGAGKGGQLIASAATGGRAPTVDMDKMFAPLASPNKSIGGEIAKGAGSYLPYGVAGGASLFGQVMAGLGYGAANTEPGESNLFGLLPNGRVGGALESGLINALTHGAFKGLEALRPSKVFRGNLPADALQRNLDITQNTETGLGDVIGAPFLKKRLENTLTSLPFSGANESLQRTGNVVVQKGENLLNKFLGNNSSENVPEQLANELNYQFNSHQQQKNNLYNEANDIADKTGLKLELPNFAKKANEVSNAIEATNMLKYEPDVESVFNKLKNYKNPVQETNVKGQILDKNGNPLTNYSTSKYPTLKEANLLKGKLNKYANMAGKHPDPAQRNMASIYGQLASSLKKDIQDSIEGTGNNELKNAYQKAEENYKNNFSPFLDKDIYKYISGNADPETIVQKFIKTSSSADLANHLTKLATKMPPQSRNLLAYSYLSRALDNEGNLNPSKLGTAVKKLGPNQLKQLVPDTDLRKQLINYTKLEGMNKEAQNLMFNPKTGQRNTDAVMTALLAYLGHIGAGNVGGLAVPTATIVGGRLLTKALTSPSLRESLVKAMIENKQKFGTPLQNITAQTGAQILNKGSS